MLFFYRCTSCEANWWRFQCAVFLWLQIVLFDYFWVHWSYLYYCFTIFHNSFVFHGNLFSCWCRFFNKTYKICCPLWRGGSLFPSCVRHFCVHEIDSGLNKRPETSGKCCFKPFCAFYQNSISALSQKNGETFTCWLISPRLLHQI